MSLLTNIEDGIKKGFRIQYELGRLSECRKQYYESNKKRTDKQLAWDMAMVDKIDKRIANFQSEIDKLNDFLGFNKE